MIVRYVLQNIEDFCCSVCVYMTDIYIYIYTSHSTELYIGKKEGERERQIDTLSSTNLQTWHDIAMH